MNRLLRHLATFLLLPVVSIGLVLFLFEIGLRIAGYQPIYEIYSKPWIFWQHDELLGWSHEPGARGRYVGPRPWPVEFEATVEINSLGLRGPEIPPREPDELRVLFLGDSMVAAFEVEYDESFVALLQQRLATRLQTPVRTINAGVRGYGTDQSYLYFRERGRILDPDLVVFYHSGNDLVDNTTIHEMRRPFGKPALAPRADQELELVGVPVPRYSPCSELILSERFEVIRRDTAATRVLCHTQSLLFDRSALFSFVALSIPWDASLLRRLYYIGNPHAAQLAAKHKAESNYSRELTLSILLALGKEVALSNAKLLIIGKREQLNQLDRGRLGEKDIDIIELDEITSRPRSEIAWHHDSHFNPVGHRLVADLLAPLLAEQLASSASDSPINQRR